MASGSNVSIRVESRDRAATLIGFPRASFACVTVQQLLCHLEKLQIFDAGSNELVVVSDTEKQVLNNSALTLGECGVGVGATLRITVKPNCNSETIASSPACPVMPLAAFGAGTKWFYKGGPCAADLRAAITAALDVGFRHIDAAEMYGNEADVGTAIRAWINCDPRNRCRDDIWVTSKVLASVGNAGTGIADACRRSVEAIGLGPLDLYLLHAPFQRDGTPFRGGLRSVWSEMLKLLDAGLAKRVGVSNFRIEDLEAIASLKSPFANQIELHPYLPQDKLLEYMARRDICAISYAPLAPITKDVCRGGAVKDVAAAIARKRCRGETAAQVLLRWSQQHAYGFSVKFSSESSVLPATVTTSSRPVRLRNALIALRWAKSTRGDRAVGLDRASMRALAAAGRLTPMRTSWTGLLPDPPLGADRLVEGEGDCSNLPEYEHSGWPFTGRAGLVVLDGGFSTRCEARGADLTSGRLWSSRLIRDDPGLVAATHEDFLRAGSECISTATYQASYRAFESEGLTSEDARSALKKGVEIARRTADNFWLKLSPEERAARYGQRPLVAASVGPKGAFLGGGAEYSGAYGLPGDKRCLAQGCQELQGILTDFHLPQMAELVSSERQKCPHAFVSCLLAFTFSAIF
jgi:diketogulonate reductase-like aldo/keto reductase